MGEKDLMPEKDRFNQFLVRVPRLVMKRSAMVRVLARREVKDD